VSTPTTTALVHLEQQTEEGALAPADLIRLRRMVLVRVPSERSKRNYAKRLNAVSGAARCRSNLIFTGHY
jgi:hypothetical protein